MIASLGMYDFADNVAANDRYWSAIRQGLRARGTCAPETLTRGEAAYWPAWRSQDLVFSQTCGLPYRSVLHDQVTLIGTPDYGLVDCRAGYYRSVFLARKEDVRDDLAAFTGARFAYNEDGSQSGWAAPQNHARALGIFLPPFLQTGAHRLSAYAVSQGQADLTAVDEVTWSFLLRQEAWCSTLKVIDRTAPTPGLPYITAKHSAAEIAFDAVRDALHQMSNTDQDLLMLRGIVQIPKADYLAIPTPPTPAQIANAE